ncbi:MAG: hypothetical protein WD749_09920 [Phycisphaerales bacterium]
MLVSRLPRSPGWVFLTLAAAVLMASWAIAASSAFQTSPGTLSIAVALDVALIIPAAYWALVVRHRLGHARTLIPIVALCILAASAIVPAGHAGVLAWARYLIIPAEVGLLAYLVYKVRAVLALGCASRAGDPIEAASAALQDALGSPFAARLIASEFAVFYYALASWGRRPQVPEGASGFAPARAATVIAVLVPIVALETVGMHMLVSRWSVLAAWILTALSAYTMLWVLGDYRAMAMRPTLVTREEVVIRVGLRCSLRAPLALIERVQSTDWRDQGRCVPGHLNMASPDSPNILVAFREPITAQRFFGVTTTVQSVGLRVQDADGMLRALHAHMANIAVS